MKNIWTKGFHSLLAIGMYLLLTAYTPLVASDISATHGCECGNADNYESGGNYYFAETVVIEGTAGETWAVNTTYSVGLVDASGAYMSEPISFTETSPGTYELNFWHLKASGYGIHVSSQAGEYLSINGVCFDHCNSSCDMSDGLLVNDCVSDDRFTFSLTPGGAGFSGTYNLTGDVSASGITGTYTSPPLLSTEGTLSVVITDTNDLSCGTTVTIEPPACAALSMNPLNNCDCTHEDNYELNGAYFFAETVLIVGDANDTWTVDMNFSVGLYDDSGNALTTPLAFTEVASGVYALDFWYTNLSGYGLHAYDSAGDYGSINNYCPDVCPSLCSIDDDGLLIGDCLPGDRFTFSINPSGAGFSGTYNLSGDVNATGVTGAYTSPPALTDVGNINVTITDAANPACSYEVLVPPPSCASNPCSIDDSGLSVGSCTPADRFIFTLDPSGLGFSGTYNLSGDVNVSNVTGVYTSPPALTNVGDLNVTIKDAANPFCEMTVYITPPNCDSNDCSIDDFNLVIHDCSPDGSRFTFTFEPTGPNFSGVYNLSGDINMTGLSGSHTSPPALTNVGLINVSVTDAADPSCSRTLYVAPPACATAPECSIDDYGLIVNDCLPDGRFTFTLNPSGAGFSGVYNLRGDVNVNGLTGAYTSPPALSNVGDINVTIKDAADPTCRVTVYIPPPACSSADPVIAAENGCDCTNSDNYELNGSTFLAEKAGIIGAADDTWTVDLTYSVGLRDASGNLMTSTTFTETSPGLYELPFWQMLGAGYGLHAYNSAGDYVSLNGVCLTPCNEPEMRLNTQTTELAISEVYPNPTTGGIVNIVFNSEASNDAIITVFDVFGQQKTAIAVTTNQGANFATIHAEQLPVGAYFIAIESNGKRSAPLRFIKAK